MSANFLYECGLPRQENAQTRGGKGYSFSWNFGAAVGRLRGVIGAYSPAARGAARVFKAPLRAGSIDAPIGKARQTVAAARAA
jgi:hypothetical protein